MLNGIVTYVRNKPRTTALMGLVGAATTAVLVWDARRGGTLYAYAPLLLCFAMHGLMHGGHGGKGHNHAPEDEQGLQRIPVEPNDRRPLNHDHR
ncbi:DUF2933 domain-containing protein [Afifella sp. H1R]|uniref:DUF2933 domain-containing protein n=1 Tax=Afifella sp. H1R TaxID=2908841 RepID=UPI001F2818B3|nr:DUF2933 domain-containing protein [Afifella sp. H1R]MCF1504090.1 DUF2933 domain-containing protein [Afifella sp. H1R]